MTEPTQGGTRIGYAKFSTVEQSFDLQTDALNVAGCDYVLVEKVSSTSAKRPELDKVIDGLRPGDTVIVWKWDRLARSFMDLLERCEQIEQRGAHLVSITEQFDTTTPVGRLLFLIMGAIKQFESDLIRERTRAGVAAARAKGNKTGGQRVTTDEQDAEILERYGRGESVSGIAKDMKISRGTVINRLQGK